MNRPRQPARAGQRPAPAAGHLPPLAALTIRFPDGQRVEIHCQPRPTGTLTIHSSRQHAPLGGDGTAEILQLTRADYLTPADRRGTTARMIFSLGGYNFDSAVTVADTLDLLTGAALAAAGITRPADAQAILAELWAAP